jgi:ABC-type multidrug transport system ATPase subunit
VTVERGSEEAAEVAGEDGRAPDGRGHDDPGGEPEPERTVGGDEDSAIRVEGLSRSFGDLDVLRDVSLSLAPGTVGAIVGPNGSGKSTLLRALAGLTPHGGTVEVATGGPRAVGYLPQNPAFRPRFTVRETLAFYADLLPEEVDVIAALDRVGMTGAADRRTEALSGGMRRLLGIAQATLGDPPLVLLDEPTSDLDPRMTEHIFGVVEDIVEDGASILLATHDARGVERSDRVFLLDEGHIVVTGTPEELRADADSALEALFAGYVSDPTAELTVRTHRRRGGEESDDENGGNGENGGDRGGEGS